MSQASVLTCLKEVFGFSTFRGDQEAVITTVLSGNSALLIMPTGMGKSLCFQLPARILSQEGRGLTLVISPLIALMKDQVDAAQAKGLRAAFINSSLSAEERNARYRKLAAGRYEILYVTPERFRIPEFREALLQSGRQSGRQGGWQNPVALLAVDEAHCISSWGHDFRLDYSRLGDIRAEIGNPVTLAVTASATPLVQADILKQLSIGDAQIFNRGVRRENLSLEVVDLHGMEQKVQAFVSYRHRFPGPAICYFSLVQSLMKFSDQISRLGFSHLIYHGQLGDRERKRSQEQFLAKTENEALILATPAFGLGIDKENVRLVMHAEIPGSLESYYQEVGRAGRDGRQAKAALFFEDDDVSIQKDFLDWASPDPGFVNAVYNLIERNPLRARQEGFDYLRTQMNFYNRRDFRVETAVGLLERWGAIEGRKPIEWKAISEPPQEYLDQALYQTRRTGQLRKLHEMVAFAKLSPEADHELCRMTELEKYFGFKDGKRCGICDLCLSHGVAHD